MPTSSSSEAPIFTALWDNSQATIRPLDSHVRVKTPVASKLAPNTGFHDSNTYFSPGDYLLTYASSNLDTIQSRQALLQELTALETPDAFYNCFGFGKLHAWLTESVYDPEQSQLLKMDIYTPRIIQYGRKGGAERLPRVGEALHHLPVSLTESRDAIAAFRATHAATSPLLAEIANQTSNSLGEVREQDIDVQSYLASGGLDQSPPLQHALTTAAGDYRHVSNASMLARSIIETPLKPISLKGTAVVLDSAFLPQYDPKGQNPLTLRLEPGTATFLTGANGSGKTFAASIIDAAARLGGAIGHAPLTEGAIPPLQVASFLNRPPSGGNGLSAFGNEVQQWARLVEALEKSTGSSLVIGDEPFASTSPEDQRKLIELFTRALGARGVMLVLTTHAEIAPLVKEGTAVAYKFARKGKQYVMEQGIGDSDAFTEAERLGLNPSILARARDLANGAPLSLDTISSRPLPHFTLLEKFEQQGIPLGLSWFKNHHPAYPENERPHWDDSMRQRYEFERAIPPYETSSMIGHELFWQYGRVSFLHDIMHHGGTTSAEIISARQGFFEAAANYPDSELASLSSEIEELQLLILALSANRFSYRDHQVPPALADPLEVLPRTLEALLANSKQLPDTASHPRTDPQAEAAYRHQLLSFTETIIATTTPHSTDYVRSLRALTTDIDTLFAPIRHRFQQPEWGFDEELYGAKNAFKLPIDARLAELRDRYYALCDMLPKLRNKERDAMDWKDTFDSVSLRGDLAQIFYDKVDYRYEGKTCHVIGKGKRTSLRYHDLRALHELVTNMDKGLGAYLRYQLRSSTMTADELPSIKNAIDELYTHCKTASDGWRTPSVRALAVLRFVAGDAHPIDTITGHFRAIGGTIATDIAHHLDTNTRAFFAGKDSGHAYSAFITKKKPNDSRRAELPIGQVDGGSWHRKAVTPFTELGDLQSLLYVATRLKKSDYRPSNIADATTISRLGSVDHPEYTRPSLTYPRAGIDIVTGANMSGKTTLLQELYTNHALAQSIGLTPSEAFTSPLYQHVLYIGRPKDNLDKGVSSFGQDIAYWQTALAKLESAAPSIVFVDEPFSTTSPTYQENLMLATFEWLAAKGHRVVVATHNHSAVQRLEDAQPASAIDISFRHLGIRITPKGKVSFTYDLQSGSAGASHAIRVAKTLGGDIISKLLEE